MAVRFVVFGDTKGKNDGINRTVLEKIMRQIKLLDKKPNFFVTLGDTIGGSNDLGKHRSQMTSFKEIVSQYFPNNLILHVVGNHEVNNFPIDDTYEKLINEEYLTFKKHGSLNICNDTAYYMDLPYCRFIVLNCYHHGELRKIENKQLEWFKKISAVDKKFKIVFIHCPPFPTGAHLGTCLDEFAEQRDEFWRAVEKSKVNIVFAGHEHNYSRRLLHGISDDISQIVTGGGGEKLRDSFKSKQGVVVSPKALYHFVVVDLDRECIEIKAISINGKVIDEFMIRN
ncbi:metallophosphoesterase [Clostridium swellfunianum]|uniref:metallophosphoesterase family protein n=1 Tax=Clostridium swellfunianum TaxID=1367462 RepID=UPI00202F45A9|nr:metallophosphoesterase [Clostridium swellfunianum]